MATYKLNIARIRGCPPPPALAEALEAFALPEDEEFGVLNHSATDRVVFGTVVRRIQQAVQRLDVEAREVTAAPVERVQVYPFGIRPRAETLEVYAGSASALEQMGLFLSGCLHLPTSVEAIELDIAPALRKLLESAERFQLRSLRVSDYAHNSYMAGPYAPKFLDTEHGMAFLEEYEEFVTAASVRFAAPTGRANARLTPKACFTYSCHEEDRPTVQSILRGLV
ncbi:MAG TPA: hypothetical protein VM031_05605 [Phycisphaerae bacterium]|nr:hypothetical protein [Phycisphaerae bacterium]